MKLPRRQFLHLAAGAAALRVVLSIATAQAYPTRPVRLIVGYPPGGTSDVVARLTASAGWHRHRCNRGLGATNGIAWPQVHEARCTRPPAGLEQATDRCSAR